jgi:hydroxyacylglutathione hydrolase
MVDEGLGNSSYLLDLGDGSALAVDASRDLRALKQVAVKAGLRIRFAADTHLHADFLTGALQLAASDGAAVLASAAGHREFPHRGLGDGYEVDLGGLTLRTVSTPGHTHEHIALELLDGARVLGVFTGGSLLVGSAARTDLVSPERTEELARAQYHSLQRLAELDDDVAVWPTHGAGSFCSAPPGADRTSTIGTERTTNKLFRAGSEDVFVKELLASLGTFPAYFSRLGEINRRGPALVTDEAMASLSAEHVAKLRAEGAEVVDVRAPEDFAVGHLPGSVSIPLRPAFATWLGWLVAPDTPIVVVRTHDQDVEEVVWQSHKIGYDRIFGELAGGVDAWIAAGKPAAVIPLVDAASLSGAQILDIRQDNEYDSGHVPGALHLELGSLMSHLRDLPSGPTVVMCGHGERAISAASLLERSGRADLAVLDGGPDEWTKVTGRGLESTR